MSGTIDTSGFNTIDFSLLPKPDVVQPVDIAALKKDSFARLTSLDGDFAEVLESDPAAKLLEVNAYDRAVDRQHVNDTAHAVMLPFARGGNLDVLGSLVGVQRLQVGTDSKKAPIYEDDERFRRRVQLAPQAFSVAGPKGAYIFWALTFCPTITDASLFLTAPGQLQLTLLGKAENGLPTEQELLQVREGFKKYQVTPFTDYLVVAPPVVTRYRLDADIWLLPGPDATLVQRKVSEAVTKFLADNRKLGRDHPRSALFAAIGQPGVSRVVLNSPPNDILIDERGVVLPLDGVRLFLAGRSE